MTQGTLISSSISALEYRTAVRCGVLHSFVSVTASHFVDPVFKKFPAVPCLLVECGLHVNVGARLRLTGTRHACQDLAQYASTDASLGPSSRTGLPMKATNSGCSSLIKTSINTHSVLTLLPF